MRSSISTLALLLVGVCLQTNADETLHLALRQHCFRCHGAGKVEGKINLADAFATKPSGLLDDLNLIEKMIKTLVDDEMPTENEPQPTQTEMPVNVSEIQMSVPPLFNDVIMGMLAKEPGNRPQMASKLLQDLKRVAKY